MSFENFPIAFVEAAACGLPIIISEVACSQDFAAMGAVITPIGDVNKLSIALKELITEENLRKLYSDKLQENVLTWDEVDEITAQF